MTSRWEDDPQRSGPRRRLYELTFEGGIWAKEQLALAAPRPTFKAAIGGAW